MFLKKKSLGQNFLKSKSVINHIISASKIKKGDLIIEIGPGQGFLTEDLIEASGNVLSIEKDNRLIDILKEKFAKQIKDKELSIDHNDILDFDIENIKGNYKLIANIPYYITGAILKKFLTANKKPKSMTLMVQKEVAKRIVAKDGKESILSLSVKAFGEPKYVKTVSKENFSPKPKVDSAILLIEEINGKKFESKEEQFLFFQIIKKAFSGKRKKIGTTLKIYKEKISDLKIDVNKRPEDLSVEDWILITRKINLSFRT